MTISDTAVVKMKWYAPSGCAQLCGDVNMIVRLFGKNKNRVNLARVVGLVTPRACSSTHYPRC